VITIGALSSFSSLISGLSFSTGATGFYGSSSFYG
jgi:hypothetical protein